MLGCGVWIGRSCAMIRRLPPPPPLPHLLASPIPQKASTHSFCFGLQVISRENERRNPVQRNQPFDLCCICVCHFCDHNSHKTMNSDVDIGWLLNVSAKCERISGTDLFKQLYVLPHWKRSCRSNYLSHPVTVNWHLVNQSRRWPYVARCLAAWPLEYQFLSHWYDSNRKKPVRESKHRT